MSANGRRARGERAKRPKAHAAPQAVCIKGRYADKTRPKALLSHTACWVVCEKGGCRAAGRPDPRAALGGWPARGGKRGLAPFDMDKKDKPNGRPGLSRYLGGRYLEIPTP